jgi:hypothetical protein
MGTATGAGGAQAPAAQSRQPAAQPIRQMATALPVTEASLLRWAQLFNQRLGRRFD